MIPLVSFSARYCNNDENDTGRQWCWFAPSSRPEAFLFFQSQNSLSHYFSLFFRDDCFTLFFPNTWLQRWRMTSKLMAQFWKMVLLISSTSNGTRSAGSLNLSLYFTESFKYSTVLPRTTFDVNCGLYRRTTNPKTRALWLKQCSKATMDQRKSMSIMKLNLQLASSRRSVSCT